MILTDIKIDLQIITKSLAGKNTLTELRLYYWVKDLNSL